MQKVYNDIDRSSSVGHYEKTKKKPRSATVEFTRHNVTGNAFCAEIKLKSLEKSITYSLTIEKMGQLNNARQKNGCNNVWSYGVKTLCILNHDVKFYYD